MEEKGELATKDRKEWKIEIENKGNRKDKKEEERRIRGRGEGKRRGILEEGNRQLRLNWKEGEIKKNHLG